MDWVPTLLAAAGTGLIPRTDRRHEPAARLNAERAPVPRRLCWRYKANAQRAIVTVISSSQDLDHTFLFNVVEDPLERANLKDRQKETIAGSSASVRLERHDVA